jgi:hypothetical protein
VLIFKKILLSLSLILSCELAYSMEYGRVDEAVEDGLDGMESKAEDNLFLILPAEIICHLMSFLEMNDPAFRYLRLYIINVELTQKQARELIFQFYTKVINQSSNLSGAANIFAEKFANLNPSFKNYEKFFYCFDCINLRIRQLTNEMSNLLMQLKTDLNQRNYGSVKVKFNNFTNAKMGSIKTGEFETLMEQALEDNLLFKELYLIINAVKADIFLTVAGIVVQDESLAPLLISFKHIITCVLLYTGGELLYKYFKNELSLKKFYSIITILGRKLIIPTAIAIGTVIPIGSLLFYQNAPSKVSMMDLLEHKLIKIKRKINRSQLNV